VDVFRGLLVAGMVLVTNAGDWNHVYWPLKHADWNGATPTDMIFPSFLFLAGVSMTFSFASRLARGATRTELAGHIVWRSLLLILFGLFLNAFPLFEMETLRIPGVLQRIGLCYLLAGVFYLTTSRRKSREAAAQLTANLPAILSAMVTLLIVYWALMRFLPVPGYGVGRLDQAGNLEGYIDRAIFGPDHLWFYGNRLWDPEGLLSTLTATVNLFLGILAGLWLRSASSAMRKITALAVAGVVLMLAGLALDPVIPINKKIWTDSFVLFSGGFSLLALALFYGLIDVRGYGRKQGMFWAPALAFGTNAVLGFALANMLTPVIALIRFQGPDGQVKTIPSVVCGVFSRFLNPWNASLAYAICFVLVNVLILWPLYRRRIFVCL